MALRVESRILFGCLILLLMGCTNGVRNVAKRDQGYIVRYGTVEGEKEVELAGDSKNKQPYLTGYRGDTKETDQPYIIRYGSTSANKDTNQHSYITRYGKAKETDDHLYITGYGKKTDQPSYINNYSDEKETEEHPYVTSYGKAKETNEHPYVTSYGKGKETNEHPYITSYGNAKETNEHPYITGYRKAKETNQHSYITNYGNAQETNEHPYITGYRQSKETNEHSYITGYRNAKERNQRTYITGYRNFEETKEPPSEDAMSKCKKHLHEHSSSQNEGHKHMGHGNHMRAQSSTDKDHTEAFKLGFFTPNDLYAGKTMALYFPIQDHSRFLPREVAESIPFSTSQLSNLLQLFSIPQGSPEAKDMEGTLLDCEVKPINGEIKLCATSLESMVEFVRSILNTGVNFNLLSTTHPTMVTALTQNYTVLEVPKEVLAPKMVFCHPVPYPYAVFFCHYFGTGTKVFQVSLGGKSEDNVEAVAVCHMDTTDWDPDHILFHLLGVKPGASSPVCHFLPANHLVWVPSPPIATE